MMHQVNKRLSMEEIKPIQDYWLFVINTKYVGESFGRLKILKVIGSKNRRAFVKCLCECGNIKESYLYSVLRGRTKSCGCLSKEPRSFKHGETSQRKYSAEYRAWASMKTAVLSRSEKIRSKYRNMSDNGVTVCDRWTDKKMGLINFLEDMGRKPSAEYRLTRLDRSKGFDGKNCAWVMWQRGKS